MRNLITDVAGLRVGNAHDSHIASGVTALIFDEPAVASVAIHGGAPGVRDSALLEPEASVETVDALVLSGGSAFGLDSMGGVMAHLRAIGRGFEIGPVRVPIAPGAIVFDLLTGGATNWADPPPWWSLGRQAAASADLTFDLGTAGAGYGATIVNMKGGLGSASAMTDDGFTVGALVVVNAVGTVLVGDGPHFWAGGDEQNGEFGGLGFPARFDSSANRSHALKGDRPGRTRRSRLSRQTLRSRKVRRSAWRSWRTTDWPAPSVPRMRQWMATWSSPQARARGAAQSTCAGWPSLGLRRRHAWLALAHAAFTRRRRSPSPERFPPGKIASQSSQNALRARRSSNSLDAGHFRTAPTHDIKRGRNDSTCRIEPARATWNKQCV